MKILAIETSCDETALSLIEAEGDKVSPKFSVLNTALYSQIEIHKEYGGVFPALAKREHTKNLIPLLNELLKLEEKKTDASWKGIEIILHKEPEMFESFKEYISTHKKPDIDLIAVTYGPGLEPALWVGINFAKALSLAWNIPVIPTNHMEGHIASVLIENKVDNFPAIALLISGGHTELVLIKDWGEYKVIGKTLDDAIGEAYDKVARMLNLPYPGGPEVSRLAKEAREKNLEDENIILPRPMIHSKDLNFSLSGLKTATLYKIKEIGDLNEDNKKIIAKEFEQAVVDILIKKTKQALEENGANTLIVGGGVIANQYIRKSLSTLANKVVFPAKDLSTDNAVMIGVAGYLKNLIVSPQINPNIIAKGNVSVEER